MSDDDCIIVAGCDSAAELLAVSRLEVLFGSSEDICGGIQPEKLACPLLGQMVRYNKKRLLAQAESLAFHCRCNHFKSFACTNFMCKERIAAVEDVGNSVFLMLTELDLGVHTAEYDMGAVVLTRASGVKKLVVLCDKLLPSVGVSPNPVLESVLDCLLLLLCQGGLLGIEHTPLFAIGVSYGVIDTHIAQI